MRNLLWLVPGLPLLGAALNGLLFYGRVGRRAVAVIACGSVAFSGLVGMAAIGGYLGSAEHRAGVGIEQTAYLWLPSATLGGGADSGAVGTAGIAVGLLLDPLSALMVFVVTFVGF